MSNRLFLPAVMIFSLAAFPLIPAVADEGEDHNDDCHIEGTESVEANVVLIATTNAPADAGGLANLEAENDGGTEVAQLEIKTHGLLAGDYGVTAIRKSDGSSVVLGSITVSECHHDGEGDGEEKDSWSGSGDNSGNEDMDDENDDEGDDADEANGVLTSETDLSLPADLNPLDIAQLIVSDGAGNPVLIGDFVIPDPESTIDFDACVKIAPDEGAPLAQGTVRLASSARKGKWKNQFQLSASGIPAKSTLDLHLDGHLVGKLKSNKNGQVALKKLPPRISTLRSVRLMDSQGRPAASAKF